MSDSPDDFNGEIDPSLYQAAVDAERRFFGDSDATSTGTFSNRPSVQADGVLGENLEDDVISMEIKALISQNVSEAIRTNPDIKLRFTASALTRFKKTYAPYFRNDQFSKNKGTHLLAETFADVLITLGEGYASYEEILKQLRQVAISIIEDGSAGIREETDRLKIRESRYDEPAYISEEFKVAEVYIATQSAARTPDYWVESDLTYTYYEPIEILKIMKGEDRRNFTPFASYFDYHNFARTAYTASDIVNGIEAILELKDPAGRGILYKESRGFLNNIVRFYREAKTKGSEA